MNTTSITTNWRRGLAGFLALGALLVCGAQPVAAQNQTSKPGVYDWGDDASGQLAQGVVGGLIPFPVPAFGNLIPGALAPFPAIAVAGGEQHSMALLADGRVMTWGDNTFGQLGRIGIGGNDPIARPIANLPKIVAIAAGGYHCLAIDARGGVWAWGEDDFGQVGNGGVVAAVPSPTRVINPLDNQDLLLGVVAIAAGEKHSLAVLKDGTVRSWGLNNYGQLGIGITDAAPHPFPLHVAILNQVFPIMNGVVIAAGGYHSLAIQTMGSAVAPTFALAYSWGANDSGQLGNGTFAALNTPTPVQDGTGNKLTGVKAVSGGLGEISFDAKQSMLIYAHSLFLMDDGVIRACGYDRYGQIGDGTILGAVPFGKPFPVVVVDGATGGKFGPSRVIAAGGLHSLAIRYDATTWDWGHNNLGQLGNNAPPFDKPLPLRTLGAFGAGFLDNTFAIAGGGRHSLAIVGVKYAGKIQLEGCVNANQNITFLFRPMNGSAQFTRTTTLTGGMGSDIGVFSFTDIPQQDYTVHIKGFKWLAANVAVDTTAGDVLGGFAYLPAGDANDDNSVDSTDFGLLIGDFGAMTGDPGYDGSTDFNCDGSTDSTDFGLLIGEFGVVGDP